MIKKFLLSLFLLIVALVIAVQYPSLFIDNVGTYKSFKIYSNSEIKIDQNVKEVLDAVQDNLSKSEFSDRVEEIELYFIRGTFYEKLIRLFGRKNIAFSKFEKHIYSAHPNFESGILKRNSNEYDWLNLVQIISHEGVHSQMYKDYYGWFTMETPFWINEGYAEYISFIPIREEGRYNLRSLFAQLEEDQGDWLKTEYGSMTPRSYMKSRLMIEYLIDVKKMEIREIIDQKELNPNDLYVEIKDYFSRK